MYVHRELEKTVITYLERKEALAIVGPRQAGKTTFIERLSENLRQRGRKVKFITFENRSDLSLFNKSIEDFKALAEQYDAVIIDEFQYASHGGQKLKYLYDTTKVKFIVSGSSSLELTFQTGKYMVGRILEFTLAPFSFREFLSFRDTELHALLDKKSSRAPHAFDPGASFGEEITKRLSARLEEYALYGGYPAVALSGLPEEKKKVLGSIADNYLLKDIKDLLRLATSDELLLLGKLLAGQIGGMVKYEELSRTCGLAYKDLKEHLNVLEKTYIITMTKPYFTNRRTELSKNPKVYFLDLGLRNYLLSDFRPLADRNDIGAIMENYARNLLERSYPSSPVKYWRTKSKAEVDFVVEDGPFLYPFEAKYSPRKAVGRSLHSFIGKFHPEKAIILTKDFSGIEKVKQTEVVFAPLSYF